MSEKCTLFIFLFEDLQCRARYFATLVSRNLTNRPLAPSVVTPEISVVRNKVIANVESYDPGKVGPTEFTRKIGIVIAAQLGLNRFFEKLVDLTDDAVVEVTLLTNDAQVPWEWAYFERKKQFFCETFDYAKLLPEKIIPGREETLVGARDPRATLATKHAILLYDDYCNSSHPLGSVLEEIDAIEESLTSAGMPADNIHKIYGADADAEYHFGEQLNAYRENLLVLHFAGHFGESGMILSNHDSIIEIEEIVDLLHGKGLNGTLVFLNACLTGRVRDIWDTEENMSTAFLSAGAAGCICTLHKVPDKTAVDFARRFYSVILEKDIGLTIAEALRLTRSSIGAGQIDRLLWTLYGYPDVVLLSDNLRI